MSALDEAIVLPAGVIRDSDRDLILTLLASAAREGETIRNSHPHRYGN